MIIKNNEKKLWFLLLIYSVLILILVITIFYMNFRISVMIKNFENAYGLQKDVYTQQLKICYENEKSTREYYHNFINSIFEEKNDN